MVRNKEQIKKVQTYRMTMSDDKTHRQLWTLRFSRMGLFLTAASTLFIIIATIFSAIAFTPLKTFLPGYPDAHSKRAAIQNAIKVDSLESVIYRWELYTENLSRILEGREPIQVDSIVRAHADLLAQGKEAQALAQRDSLLRTNVAREEQFEVSGGAARNLPIEGMHFFTPLKGVVSQGFTPAIHPAVDITAPAGTPVMSILDGTVISAGWDEKTGYSLMIQHENNLISVYRHNRELLRNQGDKVKAGTPVALVGNTGSQTTGEHLHFELWHEGEAIDPTRYISF